MRPVAMMTPDLAMIAEVMLAAEGFREARILAKKTVTLYSLMIQQLSKQVSMTVTKLRITSTCIDIETRVLMPRTGRLVFQQKAAAALYRLITRQRSEQVGRLDSRHSRVAAECISARHD